MKSPAFPSTFLSSALVSRVMFSCLPVATSFGVGQHADALTEPGGQERRDELRQGLVDPAPEAAVDDYDPIALLHGHEFVRGHWQVLLTRDPVHDLLLRRPVGRVEIHREQPAHGADLLRHLVGDRYLLAYPRGRRADLPDLLDHDLVLADLYHAPGPPTRHEGRVWLRVRRDETLIESPYHPPRGHLAYPVGPLVRDHRYVVEEVPHAVRLLPEGRLVVPQYVQLGEEPQHLVEVRPEEAPERIAPLDGRVRPILVHLRLREGHGHELVREHPQRVLAYAVPLELLEHGPPGYHEALRGLRRSRRDDAPGGGLVMPVPRPAHALYEPRDLPGRVELDREVRRADIDAELE